MKILSDLHFARLVNFDTCQLDSVERAIEEANLCKAAGGNTIVAATSIGIGRDPLGLARIARATGLNILMGAPYYVAKTHPAELHLVEKSQQAIATAIARDMLTGVEDTGIRAGLIGEVGCSWPLAKTERKILRASARAQRMTGAPLMIHPGRN
jgi:phosphotriesterase-related protein